MTTMNCSFTTVPKRDVHFQVAIDDRTREPEDPSDFNWVSVCVYDRRKYQEEDEDILGEEGSEYGLIYESPTLVNQNEKRSFHGALPSGMIPLAQNAHELMIRILIVADEEGEIEYPCTVETLRDKKLTFIIEEGQDPILKFTRLPRPSPRSQRITRS